MHRYHLGRGRPGRSQEAVASWHGSVRVWASIRANRQQAGDGKAAMGTARPADMAVAAVTAVAGSGGGGGTGGIVTVSGGRLMFCCVLYEHRVKELVRATEGNKNEAARPRHGGRRERGG